MGIILSKTADSEQAVQNAGLFITVDRAQLKEADGKIAVAHGFSLIDQNVAGAVHGLDDVILLIDLHEIHVLTVIIGMAGGIKEVDLGDMRDTNELIATFEIFIAEELLDNIPNDRALGVIVDKTCPRLFVEGEKIQLPAQPAVISLFGFLKVLEIIIHLFLSVERCPIDPRQAESVRRRSIQVDHQGSTCS